MRIANLFARLPPSLKDEFVEQLLTGETFRLERIVSRGHATPPGQWCDQDSDEWVVLVAGSAGLQFEGEPAIRQLRPGDYVLIPAHLRHRVEWTDPDQASVWLALHWLPSLGD